MIKKKKHSSSNPKVSVYDIFFQEVPIAQIRSYKDYVKRNQSDTIRTKFTKLQDVIWNKAGLKTLFPDKEPQIESLSNHHQIESKEGSASFWINSTLNNLQ